MNIGAQATALYNAIHNDPTHVLTGVLYDVETGSPINSVTLQLTEPEAEAVEVTGQILGLGLSLSQATLQSIEPPIIPETTIDTIPPTINELVRMLITAGQAGAGQWYSRFQGGNIGFYI